MKKRHKIFLKVNLVSIFFIVVSFISVTLAWFAYSGNARLGTEIGIKAWLIELEKDGKSITNDLTISLSEIYPGMETMTELVRINNLGDSDAEINYSIISARILGEPEDLYIVNDNSKEVEDKLSHEYPFHININLTKSFIGSKNGESYFEVSISWPLDSGDDNNDSMWGNKAHYFLNNEYNLHNSDPEYQIRPSIQVKINLSAQQYVEEEESIDPLFPIQKQILYDVIENKICSTISETCLKTSVIDTTNKVGDSNVNLLVSFNNDNKSSYNDYLSVLHNISSAWNVTVKPLTAEKVLSVISQDIDNSLKIRTGFSNAIIGNLDYGNRINTVLGDIISSNGYFQYLNDKFPILYSATCIWTNTNYNSEYGFAINEVNYENSKLYNLEKSNECTVLPVIEIEKSKLK